VVCGVWCVVCGVWCVVCGVWCVVCGVWCVVCGVWCVVCGVCDICIVEQRDQSRNYEFAEMKCIELSIEVSIFL